MAYVGSALLPTPPAGEPDADRSRTSRRGCRRAPSRASWPMRAMSSDADEREDDVVRPHRPERRDDVLVGERLAADQADVVDRENDRKLTPITSPTPPRGKRSAIGAPTSTSTMHAAASENFFWISIAVAIPPVPGVVEAYLGVGRLARDERLEIVSGGPPGGRRTDRCTRRRVRAGRRNWRRRNRGRRARRWRIGTKDRPRRTAGDRRRSRGGTERRGRLGDEGARGNLIPGDSLDDAADHHDHRIRFHERLGRGFLRGVRQPLGRILVMRRVLSRRCAAGTSPARRPPRAWARADCRGGVCS